MRRTAFKGRFPLYVRECCSIMHFNRIDTPGYKEEGYLPNGKNIRSGAQEPLNRKLCILELGAGMEYPTVIQFPPLKRLPISTEKARFYRVHSRLYQMTAELKEKGVSIQAKSRRSFRKIEWTGGLQVQNKYAGHYGNEIK